MTHETRTSIRLSHQLLAAATEAARQQRESLSAVLRRHLEAYASSEPLKQAQNPDNQTGTVQG